MVENYYLPMVFVDNGELLDTKRLLVTTSQYFAMRKQT